MLRSKSKQSFDRSTNCQSIAILQRSILKCTWVMLTCLSWCTCNEPPKRASMSGVTVVMSRMYTCTRRIDHRKLATLSSGKFRNSCVHKTARCHLPRLFPVAAPPSYFLDCFQARSDKTMNGLLLTAGSQNSERKKHNIYKGMREYACTRALDNC